MAKAKKVTKETYPWFKFDRDTRKIAQWAKRQRPRFTSVYGIPRGGLVIAVRLSHLLHVPLVLSREDITKRTLIVDDIVDGGATIGRLLFALGPGFSVASIFFNAESTHEPNFFVRKKESWVVFPWETRGSSRYDGTI